MAIDDKDLDDLAWEFTSIDDHTDGLVIARLIDDATITEYIEESMRTRLDQPIAPGSALRLHRRQRDLLEPVAFFSKWMTLLCAACACFFGFAFYIDKSTIATGALLIGIGLCAIASPAVVAWMYVRKRRTWEGVVRDITVADRVAMYKAVDEARSAIIYTESPQRARDILDRRLGFTVDTTTA